MSMTIKNVSKRTYIVKNGQEELSLAPNQSCKVAKAYGESLMNSFKGEFEIAAMAPTVAEAEKILADAKASEQKKLDDEKAVEQKKLDDEKKKDEKKK